jgi:copper(I)-binding protein
MVVHHIQDDGDAMRMRRLDEFEEARGSAKGSLDGNGWDGS